MTDIYLTANNWAFAGCVRVRVTFGRSVNGNGKATSRILPALHLRNKSRNQRLQGFNPLFQLGQSPKDRLLFFAFSDQNVLFVPMLYECFAVQTQPFQVKFACTSKGTHSSVLCCDQMLRQNVSHRMENAMLRFRLPVVTFERIAGMTAIDQIIQRVAAALRARLKVIQGQWRP